MMLRVKVVHLALYNENGFRKYYISLLQFHLPHRPKGARILEYMLPFFKDNFANSSSISH